jgi:hypothetical protein
LYSSPSIIRRIKVNEMRWARHLTGMGEKRNAYSYWWKARGKEAARETKTQES